MSHERRSFFAEEEQAEPGQYGCSMLARVRPSANGHGRPKWRCSLGWSVFGEEELANCMATEAVIDCWRVHPERKQVIALTVVPVEDAKLSAD